MMLRYRIATPSMLPWGSTRDGRMGIVGEFEKSGGLLLSIS